MKSVCRKICEFLIDNEVIATCVCTGLYYEPVQDIHQKDYLTFEEFFNDVPVSTTNLTTYDKLFFWSKRAIIIDSYSGKEITITEKNFKPITARFFYTQATNLVSIDSLAKRLTCEDFLEWARDNKLFSN